MESKNEVMVKLLQFVTMYRKMENSIFAAEKIIHSFCADSKMRRHHLNSWVAKEHGFGQFFLNLRYEDRIKIIHIFNISDPIGQAWLKKEWNDIIERTFAQPEGFVLLANSLLLHFENNGINPDVELGITEDMLPAWEGRYGNSKNWGAFVERYPEVMAAILTKRGVELS